MPADDRLLHFQDGEVFATAAAEYFTGEAGAVTAGRLMITIAIEGQSTIAIVDTGSPYLICSPDLVPQIEPYLTDSLGPLSLGIRRDTYQGELYRLTAEIIPHSGEGCQIEATVFVPRLLPDQPWPYPSFVGWAGMLERLRFAVDPDSSTIFFGPLN